MMGIMARGLLRPNSLRYPSRQHQCNAEATAPRPPAAVPRCRTLPQHRWSSPNPDWSMRLTKKSGPPAAGRGGVAGEPRGHRHAGNLGESICTGTRSASHLQLRYTVCVLQRTSRGMRPLARAA